MVHITSTFDDKITEIGYMFLATGETNSVTVSNGRINLLLDRMYYVPIDKKDIDSEKFTIKVVSNVADKIDVKLIKDGFAYVTPIRHNVLVRNGEKLCVLIPIPEEEVLVNV